MVEWLRALSPHMRKLARIALALMAAQVLLIVLRAAEFVFGAPTSVWVPTTLLMFAVGPAAIGQSLHMRRVRLAETAQRQREAAERKEFRRLRASDPAPGQCPVCGLADLNERAIGDELLGDSGTALARVVPYGPGRAHAECAEVVPHVAPQCVGSDPQRALVHLLGGVTAEHFGYLLGGQLNLCRCAQCERGRPKPKPRATKGGYLAGNLSASEMGPVPEVLLRPGLGVPVVNNTLRDSVEVPPEWSGFGVESFAEVQNWRRHGFTPERAKAWIQNGFATPQEANATGFRSPNDLRAANGWPLFEPEQDGWPMPAVVPGHVAFTMNGKHTYCGCDECESLRRERR